jgi:hypothetical protein
MGESGDLLSPMKAPPNRPALPAPRGPRDTLDDIDRELDAVHGLTEPFDVLREAPTDLQPSLGEDAKPIDPRELPTGAALHRSTAPWMNATPYVNPDAETGPKRDPWFLPVFIFVVVLLTCIGVFLYQETHKIH